jgi:hypothetical protein
MQRGGNKLINAIFEANLPAASKGDIKPDNTTEMEKRAAFIFDKYQHRNWYNIAAYKVMAPQVNPNRNTTRHSSFPLEPELDLFSEANMNANKMDLFSTASMSAHEDGMHGPTSVETFEKEPDSDWWKMNASKKSREAAQPSSMGNSSHDDSMKEIHFDPNAYAGSMPAVTSKSFVPPVPGYSSTSARVTTRRNPTRTPAFPGAAPPALANLTRTMQRMESKAKLLDELNRMDIDPDAPKPKKSSGRSKSRSHGREKLSKKPSFESEGSGENRGSNSRRKGVSRSKSREGGAFSTPESDGHRNTVGRTASMNSSDHKTPRSSRRRGVARSSSSCEDLNASKSGENSGTDPQPLKQTIVKSSSDDGAKVGEQLEQTSSNSGRSSRLPREPRKIVGRTRSLEADFFDEAPPPPRPVRARSRSVKRRPRRLTSTTGEALDMPEPGSDLGQFEDSFGSFLKKDDDAASNVGGRSRSNAPDDDFSSSTSQSRRSRASEDGTNPRRRRQSVDAKSARRARAKDKATSRSRSPSREISITGRDRGISPTPPSPTRGEPQERRRDRRRNEKSSMAPPSLTEEVGKLLGL